jgi:hypothetical protein
MKQLADVFAEALSGDVPAERAGGGRSLADAVQRAIADTASSDGVDTEAAVTAVAELARSLDERLAVVETVLAARDRELAAERQAFSAAASQAKRIEAELRAKVAAGQAAEERHHARIAQVTGSFGFRVERKLRHLARRLLGDRVARRRSAVAPAPEAKTVPEARTEVSGSVAGAGSAAPEFLPGPRLGLPPSVDPKTGYRRSGYRPHGIGQPFVTRVEVTKRDLRLDDTAALAYIQPKSGKEVFQPVTTAQWAMGSHTHHLTTGLGVWLDLAKASAQKLLDGRVESGDAYFFPHDFNWQGHAGEELKAPWYSGMAQGEALSVFVQMAAEFPNEPRWRAAADAVFASLLVPWSDTEPSVTHVVDGFLWFEEYACPNPYQVLNGHIFALFGVYEYWNATHDPAALELFDGAVTTALHAAELARSPGTGSLYCVNPEICIANSWRSPTYHPIHIAQFRMLAEMAGEPLFDDWAVAYASDKPGLRPWRVAALWPGGGGAR